MSDEGHQLASHGSLHQSVKYHTKKQFYEDVTSNKKILEDMIGKAIDTVSYTHLTLPTKRIV